MDSVEGLLLGEQSENSNSIINNNNITNTCYNELQINALKHFNSLDAFSTVNKKKSGLACSDPWVGIDEEDYFLFNNTSEIIASRRTSMVNKKNADAIVIDGSMFSGKSLELISTLTNFAVAGYRVILLSIDYDTRYGVQPGIKTHNGLTMNNSSHENIKTFSINRESMSRFVNGKERLPIGGVDVIGIDEIQFWAVQDFGTDSEGVIKLAREVITFRNRCVNVWGITLVAAGLNSWASGDPTVHIHALKGTPHIHKQLFAVCEICQRKNAMRTATRGDFIKMMNGNYTLEDVRRGPKVELGGRDGYIPLCEMCYTAAIMRCIKVEEETEWLKELDKRLYPSMYLLM